jgi:hypothetical protein
MGDRRLSRQEIEDLAASLSDDGLSAMAPLLEAVGLPGPHVQGDERDAAADRQLLWEAFYHHLGVQTGEPVWSSLVLQRGVVALSRRSAEPLLEAFTALREMLGRDERPLSVAAKNFLHDLMAANAASGRSAELEGLFSKVSAERAKAATPSAAQAFLDFTLLPAAPVDGAALVQVLARLANTDEWPDVERSLEGEMPTFDPHGTLPERIAGETGITAEQRERLIRLCGEQRS